MLVESPNKAWQRALSTLAALAIAVTVIAALYWARSVFIPVTMAIFLAFVLNPLVVRLRRLGLGKAPTVLLAVALAGLLVSAVLAIVTWQFSELVDTLPGRAGAIKAKIASAKEAMGIGGKNRFAEMFDDISGAVAPSPPPDQTKATSTGTTWWSSLPGYLSPATEIFGQAAFALVLSVFILWKRDDLRNRFIRLIGDTRLTTATKAVDDASKRVSRYLLTQLLINTAFGVLITIAMFFIDVPYAILWGVVASLMRYVPYLGTWLGLLPAVLVTVAFTDGWWQPVVVIAVYGVLELICNNVLEPRFYGSSLGVSEVAQLIAAAFWTFLWGPVGLVLSGPLTVCLLVLGKNVSGLKFFEILLGDEDVLSADLRFYQRLTARDQDEAWEIIRDETKTRSRADVFDTVVVPALTYAKRDWEQGDLSGDDLAQILAMLREIVDDATEPAPAKTDPEAAVVEEIPEREKIRVMLIPAKDNSDELAGNMLRLLLDSNKWEVDVSPVAQLTSEVIERAAAFNPAVIIICTLPPGGLTHTRYVCKRIAKQFAKAQIVVNRCEVTALTPEVTNQLSDAGAAHVTASLTQTVHHLNSWQGALDNRQKVAVKVKDGRDIGTASAKLNPVECRNSSETTDRGEDHGRTP